MEPSSPSATVRPSRLTPPSFRSIGDPPSAGITVEGWNALQRAATLACERWNDVIDGRVPPAELAPHAALLCVAVRQAIAGEEPRLRDIPPAVPARRLLEALRRSFLDESNSSVNAIAADELVRMMRAFERVQDRLDQDVAQRFTSRLSGADALDLIVEVAHDMRSPLGSILFLVETLRRARSGPITAIQERQLGLVYNAAFGLSSLASDIIELARGCDRLVDLRPLPFSVTEIMQSVLDIVHPIAEEKGLTVHVTAPDVDFRIGHSAALNRVLLNLTTNALKFTSEGVVEVTAKPIGRSKIEFSVRDTGRGIPPAVMATLFEAFRGRQRPGEYAFSSAGLGLAICRKLVEAMGAALCVDTSPDSGTRFYFELELPPAAKM